MSNMELYLGNYGKEERIAREMFENGPDGAKCVSALHHFNTFMEMMWRYAEAESMSREVLPWIEELELYWVCCDEHLEGWGDMGTWRSGLRGVGGPLSKWKRDCLESIGMMRENNWRMMWRVWKI
jgi:hypothetical protein